MGCMDCQMGDISVYLMTSKNKRYFSKNKKKKKE